mmetsp:Transcript_119610/g.168248  ORF Transcript_119610/g.168248 Transcript_119610/m.168248 type:complete len:340 (-) Transcript_119610:517-1536(-)
MSRNVSCTCWLARSISRLFTRQLMASDDRTSERLIHSLTGIQKRELSLLGMLATPVSPGTSLQPTNHHRQSHQGRQNEACQAQVAEPPLHFSLRRQARQHLEFLKAGLGPADSVRMLLLRGPGSMQQAPIGVHPVREDVASRRHLASLLTFRRARGDHRRHQVAVVGNPDSSACILGVTCLKGRAQTRHRSRLRLRNDRLGACLGPTDGHVTRKGCDVVIQQPATFGVNVVCEPATERQGLAGVLTSIGICDISWCLHCCMTICLAAVGATRSRNRSHHDQLAGPCDVVPRLVAITFHSLDTELGPTDSKLAFMLCHIGALKPARPSVVVEGPELTRWL